MKRRRPAPYRCSGPSWREDPGQPTPRAYPIIAPSKGPKGKAVGRDLLGQPIAREARDDPAADQRDQQHHHADADPNAVVAVPLKCASRWKATFPASSNATSTTTGDCASCCPHDFPRGDGNDQREKAASSTARRPIRIGGKRHDDPSDDPHQKSATSGVP